MATTTALGEFEQLVMLAVLRLEEAARARDIRLEIEQRAARRVTRGALYATLERLETKGYLTWETESATPQRGGIPRRRFIVTKRGLAAVRSSQQALASMSEGLERLLREKP